MPVCHGGGIFALFLTLFLSACSKSETDEPQPVDPVRKKITLTLRAPSTRTSLENDRTVVWNEGDRIIVNNLEYPVVPDPDDPTAATVADVPESASYLVLYNGIGSTPDGVFFLLPNGQSYKANTFADQVNPMVAWGESPELTMRHLCGIIRIAVTGDASLSTLSLTGNDGEPLAGYLLLPVDELTNGRYTAAANPNYQTYPSIRMECPEPVALDPATPTYFYFVVPAATYAKGFNVAMTASDGTTAIQSTTRSVTVDRAGIKAMEPFAFTPVPEVTLTVDGTTHSSISYSVGAKAGSTIRTLVVSQQMWDYYINENPYYVEHPDELPMQILTQLGETVSVDESGVYSVEATQARNKSGMAAVAAATDYKILASYADGDTSIGNVSQQDVRTADPTGTAPQLRVEQVEDTFRPYAQLTFHVKTDGAVSIRRCMYVRSAYEQLAGRFSDAELIGRDGIGFPDEKVAEANATGMTLNYMMCEPSTDYVLLIGAAGEGGMETVAKKEASTTAYYDPDASWTVLSNRATLDCGLFSALGIGMFRIEGLTVEKIATGDLFRIRDPFSTTRVPLLAEAGLTDKADGPYYLFIDARDPDAVLLEDFVNDSGLESSSNNLTFIRFVSLPLIAAVSPDEYPYGTYDAGQGIICLNRPGLWCDQGLYASQTPTTLHFNLSRTGGFTTEDFNLSDPVSW